MNTNPITKINKPAGFDLTVSNIWLGRRSWWKFTCPDCGESGRLHRTHKTRKEAKDGLYKHQKTCQARMGVNKATA